MKFDKKLKLFGYTVCIEFDTTFDNCWKRPFLLIDIEHNFNQVLFTRVWGALPPPPKPSFTVLPNDPNRSKYLAQARNSDTYKRAIAAFNDPIKVAEAKKLLKQ